jgi:hypothetical protein
VADFGTAREGASADSGGTHAVTQNVAGTRGFMPPEYCASALAALACCRWSP